MSPIGLVILIICAVSTKELYRRHSTKIIPRIISGKPSQPGQFPWQVLIKKSEKDDIYCGGSIISKDWVLTAAHCIYGLKSLFMVFGANNINDKPVAITSTKLYYHNEYNPNNLNNDIGLVKLPTSLKFRRTIQPISLIKRRSAADKFIGKVGRVSGWGYMSDEDLDYANILQFTTLTVIPNNECLKKFGEIFITNSTLCAQGTPQLHESTCSGDSGGAFVIDIDGGQVQIGINSFVAQYICSEGHPAGFVRVGSYLDYIENMTGIKFD